MPQDRRSVATLGRAEEQDGITTAVVEDISPDGVARILLSGETMSCEASSLITFTSAAAACAALLGQTVVVLRNGPLRPVILGAVAERLWDSRDGEARAEAQASLEVGQPLAVQLDQRRLELDAADEIRLTCGKSSLLLRRDGTIVLKGVTITSRASQTNKIRGATVNIN